jgi:protein-arginine kinase activator protein McsA
MLKAAADLEFEEAARLRDEIDKLKNSRSAGKPQKMARNKRK